MEHGQPLHAFDCDKLPKKPSMFRRATEGGTLVTLDGEERTFRKRNRDYFRRQTQSH